MSDLLRELFAAKRLRRTENERRESYAELAERAEARRTERRPFAAALASARGGALVAEIKRASPSAGTIVTTFDVAATAARYDRAGADAISVLTEESRFLGDLAHLDVARAASSLAILRKDFLSDPYDVVQSAAYGADAILLIVAGLDDFTLQRLRKEAQRFGLETLVEVHDERELVRAIGLQPAVIGVNNRDLRTFVTDLTVSERLIPRIPQRIVAIAESGVRTSADAARLAASGARGVLVGESLMRDDDPEELARALKAAWAGAGALT